MVNNLDCGNFWWELGVNERKLQCVTLVFMLFIICFFTQLIFFALFKDQETRDMDMEDPASVSIHKHMYKYWQNILLF